VSIAQVDELDAIITDRDLPPETAERYRAAGVNVTICSGPAAEYDGSSPLGGRGS
jgi:hypothetical protein